MGVKDCCRLFIKLLFIIFNIIAAVSMKIYRCENMYILYVIDTFPLADWVHYCCIGDSLIGELSFCICYISINIT